MAKQELFRNALFATVLRWLRAFPVKRGSPDRRAIREALSRLNSGRVIGMFPEGTRARGEDLGSPHNGAALLAHKSQAPVVPAAVVGPYRFGRALTIRYGRPIQLFPAGVETVSARDLDEASQRIMDAIRELLQGGTRGSTGGMLSS